MGNRVSIQFVNKNEKSPYLFSHWGGEDFVEEVKEYVQELKAEAKEKGGMYPLHRLEPHTVFVDFIKQYTRAEEGRVESDLYATCTEGEGDNSDNGHFDIDLAAD